MLRVNIFSRAKTKRVLLTIGHLRRGGAERVAVWLANSLAAKGWDVTLLTLCGPDEPRDFTPSANVRLLHADIFWPSVGLDRISDGLKRMRTLRRTIRQTSPDVVVSFLDTVNVRMLLASVGLGVPVAVSERIDPRRHHLPAPWPQLRRAVYPLADVLIIQTEGLRAAWPESWQRLVRVIPNPVRLLPTKSHVELPPRTILCVARLAPQKGLDSLMRSFASIAEAADAHLVLLGEGPQREELVALAQRLGIAERVRMPGETDDVGAWLAAAQIFALASHYEGQPNALAEAMAAGLPAVATNTPGARSLVQHGKNGLLVPCGDEGAMAQALANILSDALLAARLGAAAARLLNEQSEARILALWMDLLTKLVSGPARRRQA